MRTFSVLLVLSSAVLLGCGRESSSTLQTEHLEHVNEANFKEKVLDSQVPVLVDFYADWCRPCKMLAPLLEEIASEKPKVKLVKVNVDENPRLATHYQISGIPNLKMFKNGRVVAQHVGLADKRQLNALLAECDLTN
jgi:thioredoxin 1